MTKHGPLSMLSMRLAARAAVLNLKALERIEQDFGEIGDEGPQFTDDEFSRALAKGDINTVAKALPGILQQALSPDEEAPQ